MRHHKTVKKLDRNHAGRKALYKSLALSLMQEERIRTTEAKAKAIRPIIEKLITKARIDSEATRRYLFQHLQNKEVVEKMITTIGPKYRSRPGGYTRIVKMVQRQGDGAKMAIIELVK